MESLNEVEPNDCILTDDKTPIELLGISAIDNMIIGEIGYYKDEIKGKSIGQLIKELQAGTLL